MNKPYSAKRSSGILSSDPAIDESAAVYKLDAVMLGATQVDTDFNVNVHTDSNGFIMGGSGGHCDTAKGAKLSIIIAPLFRSRLPLVTDRVITVSTPGETVDVVVTQRGIAVNTKYGKNKELKEKLSSIRLEFEDLQSDLESESSDIEPYENREELTELQEQRQEWLDNTASTIEETVNSLQEAEDNLDNIEE